jgi:uncharacterized protein
LLSYRWRVAATPFEVRASDGVRIAGSRLGASDAPALVMAHGLMGWHRKPKFARFAQEMSRNFCVYALDLRGHGSSQGVVDYGCGEIDDVEAVVRLARAGGHPGVVTCGISMGAIAVLRHAGIIGGVDTVVSISSLAGWNWHEGATPGARKKMQARIATPLGRGAMRVWGVRLPDEWDAGASPEDVVAAISPIPLILVHGRNDHLFSIDHAQRLFELAGPPKRLLVGDRFGHAEDGLSPAFASKLSAVVLEGLATSWPA